MLTDGPLRVAILCSRRAPGAADLLSDPNRGDVFEPVCLLTSDAAFPERDIPGASGIPVLRHPIRDACRESGAKLSDLEFRKLYDFETLRLIQPYRPDAIVLAGYLLILTAPVLEAFPGRIVNVHGSDLTIRDAAGAPKYPGLRAVADSIFAGERETRATAHVVTGRLDDGPILGRSAPFPVAPLATYARRHNADAMLKAYAFAHQEWMLRLAWGPLLRHAMICLSKPSIPSAEGMPIPPASRVIQLGLTA